MYRFILRFIYSSLLEAGFTGCEKPIQGVILSSSEGSAFEFSSTYRFFVTCWLLRMTSPMSFSAACLAPHAST